MKTAFKPWLAGGIVAMLVLGAGCSNNDNDGNNGVGNSGNGGNPGSGAAASVPDSAGTSGANFIAYLMGLSATDETSEPLLIKDSLAVPADESSSSQMLS